jgi:hypothetical protein
MSTVASYVASTVGVASGVRAQRVAGDVVADVAVIPLCELGVDQEC